MVDAAVARLVTTLAAPLDRVRDAADAPDLLRWPASGGGRSAGGRRLLVQHGDTELAVVDPDSPDAAAVRFPAPWPRGFGTCTVAPDGGLAVFAGVHAVRAVDRTGAVRWEVRHGCREGSCRTLHTTYAEYAADRRHLHADSGSAVFSADGSRVWAHVRGPVAAFGPDPEALDEWLVLDAADGRVLGRAEAETAAVGSDHVPHPDPARMGLCVGEGQDGVPMLWGRWDGEKLSVQRFCDDERILTDVSPSGDRFLTVTHYEETLGVHRVVDGAVLSELDTEHTVPRHPGADPDDRDADETLWDYACGFLDEETVVAGTSERDEEYGEARHWLVGTAGAEMRLTAQLTYPFPASGAPTALGDGTWYTVSEAGDALHVWSR
ncbi:hypothetical protein PUR34_07635 [Streptomyces sp. JV185]|uniref:hypothetical protein n=1 Tax=Streptomyces sp. JV185 TaxID=858638 RepID=UPI002E769606|nr:hypothetical protein [Streptomyces sp. JV185]MEE1768061.1 hypothetical protein [Streptomyces sp. JV185]